MHRAFLRHVHLLWGFPVSLILLVINNRYCSPSLLLQVVSFTHHTALIGIIILLTAFSMASLTLEFNRVLHAHANAGTQARS